LETFEKTKKKLIITTTCLDDDMVCYISHIEEPDMPLYLAIKMSMCIPLFYIPIFYKGKYYIDGGCKDNYPISIFRHIHSNVLGLFLQQKNITSPIMKIEDYFQHLVWCLINNSSRDIENYKDRTVIIEINDVGMFDFAIGSKKKGELFRIGYVTIMEKFAHDI